MSESMPTVEAAQPDPESADQAAPPPEDATDWKAEARKWEDRAKANKDAAARLAQLEEAGKSEAQKAAEQLARLQAENEAYKRRDQIAGWAADAAKATGVDASLLRGNTAEEITAHAEQLKAYAEQLKAPNGPIVPSAGRTPTRKGNTEDHQFVRELFGQ